MKLDALKSGFAALNAGAWIGNIPLPLLDGVKLKVTRLWSGDFSDLYDKTLASLSGDLTDGQKADKAMDECLARVVLLDWEGIEDAYTPEVGVALLADPDAGPSFRRAILWAATQLTEQVKASIEAAEKN